MSGDFSWQPNAEGGISVRFVEANGLNFEIAESGDKASATLVLMLHGFPELNYSWRYQMPVLAAKGYRVWAPNMRGYGASSKPEGIPAYHIDNLLADVAELIERANKEHPVERLVLIAHDWGAVIAWMFAIRKIRRVDQLVIMNVPHPKCAEREIRKWRQLRKSWYMFFFQIPRLPERLLLSGNARAIRGAFFNSAANKANFSGADLDVYAASAKRPGAIRAMLNYYRALFRFRDPAALGDAKVDVPTLVIWGENDLALDIHLLDGMEAWVPSLTVHRLPGISHWVQQDAPEQVNRLMVDWLEQPAS